MTKTFQIEIKSFVVLCSLFSVLAASFTWVMGLGLAEQVYFKQFPDDLADKLIEERSCFNCAGGLMVEHPLVAPYIEKVVGDMDSVMGLSRRMMLHLLVMASEPQVPQD